MCFNFVYTPGAQQVSDLWRAMNHKNHSKFLKTSAAQMKSKSRRQKRPFVRIRPIKISDFEFVRSLASKTKGYTVCPPYILREYLARQQTSTPLSERQGTQTPSLAPRAPPSRLKPGRKRKVFVVCSVATPGISLPPQANGGPDSSGVDPTAATSGGSSDTIANDIAY